MPTTEELVRDFYGHDAPRGEDAYLELVRQQGAIAIEAIVASEASQRVDDAGQLAACERFAFNSWNCLVAHCPLGTMSRACKETYAALTHFRKQQM